MATSSDFLLGLHADSHCCSEEEEEGKAVLANNLKHLKLLHNNNLQPPSPVGGGWGAVQ